MATSAPRRRVRDTLPDLGRFPAYVAEYRRGFGLTQQELADLAGVSVSSVRALESGRATMSLAMAARILDALGLVLVAGPPTEFRVRGVRGVVLRPDAR